MKTHFWFSKLMIEQWVNNLAHKNITKLQKLWTLKINHSILRSILLDVDDCIQEACIQQ